MSLHADATAALTAWEGPDADQAQLRQHFLDHLAAAPEAMWRSCPGAHLTASALVLSADRRQTLLTLHTKAGLWLQTGGHCEPEDSTLVGAALREATEESGIAGLIIDPTPVRLSRHAVPFCRPAGSRPEQPTDHLDVQFVVTAPPGARHVRSDESDDLRWFDIDDLPAATDDEVRRLVHAAGRGKTSPNR